MVMSILQIIIIIMLSSFKSEKLQHLIFHAHWAPFKWKWHSCTWCGTFELLYNSKSTQTTLNFPFVQLHVWTELNKEQLRRDLQLVLDNGISSLSVVLMHSYT